MAQLDNEKTGTGGMSNVRFGVYVPQVALTFDELLRHAVRCEELGFDSMWLYDHLYAPGLPNQPSLDAWTLATALLTKTRRLRVGHLVLNNNLRHPALLAKMATTLDVVSGGRLELGLGSGSWEPEHRESGIEWGTLAERSSRLDESLAVITHMFGSDRTTFDGRYFQIHDLPNLPRPVQAPHPPIHVGGIGERFTLPLVARYADVWNVPTYGLATWRSKHDVLQGICEQQGRDPASIGISHEAVLALAPNAASLRSVRQRAEHRYAEEGWGLDAGGYVGTPDEISERIAARVEEGVRLFVFFPSDRGSGPALELFADEVMPQFSGPPAASPSTP